MLERLRILPTAEMIAALRREMQGLQQEMQADRHAFQAARNRFELEMDALRQEMQSERAAFQAALEELRFLNRNNTQKHIEDLARTIDAALVTLVLNNAPGG